MMEEIVARISHITSDKKIPFEAIVSKVNTFSD
jgi:hypothetical protein